MRYELTPQQIEILREWVATTPKAKVDETLRDLRAIAEGRATATRPLITLR